MEYTMKLKSSEIMKLHLAIIKFICEEIDCERCILNNGKDKCIPNKLISQNLEDVENEIVNNTIKCCNKSNAKKGE